MALALVPQARGRGAKIAKSGKKTTTFDPISEGTRRVYFGSWSAIRRPRNLHQFTRSASPWPEKWPAIRRQQTSNHRTRPAAR